MRKIFFALMCCATIIALNPNRAAAYDQYVGTYEDGYAAYLMTETLIGTDGYNFRCTVKAAKYDDYVYIGYTFWLDGAFYAKSSQGFFGEVDKYKTPVVYNLTRFVQNNFVFR